MEKISEEHKIKYPKHIHMEGEKSIVSREIHHKSIFMNMEDEPIKIKKKINYWWGDFYVYGDWYEEDEYSY